MSAEPASAIQFLPPQQEVFWAQFRIFFMLWRRQLGKSFVLGAKALSRMMQRRGHSVFFVSASIALGQENIRKEAEVWQHLLEYFRQVADQGGLRMTSNADALDLDAVSELFEASKLEARIWHDRTSYSRTKVVAPNPATARGYTGDVFGDEFAFWPEFEGVWDAVEPIISRNPEFLMLCATTPSKDDTHPTFELLDPGATVFPVNPRGNWYETESGYPVHRVDAYDAEAAGLPLYDRDSGAPITLEHARAAALNKAAFDRNYLLKFLSGGSAAIARHLLHAAQEKGAAEGLGLDLTDSLRAA